MRKVSESDVTPLTPSGIQASLLKAQTLSSEKSAVRSLLIKEEAKPDTKQENIDGKC